MCSSLCGFSAGTTMGFILYKNVAHDWYGFSVKSVLHAHVFGLLGSRALLGSWRTFRRWGFAGGGESLRTQAQFFQNLCLLTLPCLFCHDELYPLKLWVRISPSVCALFLLVCGHTEKSNQHKYYLKYNCWVMKIAPGSKVCQPSAKKLQVFFYT